MKNEFLHYYIGQMCQITDRNGYTQDKILTGSMYSQVLIGAFGVTAKPHLRPLSTMTDDEKAKLYDLIFPEESAKSDEIKIAALSFFFEEDGEYIIPPLGFHYLIKKGFDIFGLIEKGEAIEKK